MITIQQNEQLSPVDLVFVNSISNRLTLYGQIPYTIPELLIVDIIKSAARYFFKYYYSSWSQRNYLIKRADIMNLFDNNTGFIGMSIFISPRVRVIKEVYEANVSDVGSMSAAMYETQKYGQQNELYGSTVNNNLFILQTAIKMVEARGWDNMFSARMPYDYNTNTNELIFKQVPKADIVLDTLADVDIQNLYNDTFFERYVLAKTKIDLKRLIGSHTFQLPGEVTVSGEEICAGWEDAEKIEEIIKNSSGIGDIILKRR